MKKINDKNVENVEKNLKKKLLEYIIHTCLNVIIRSKRQNVVVKKYAQKTRQKNTKITTAERKFSMIRERNLWILLIFLLCGIVIGGLIANCASQVSWLSWLAYGEEFGTSGPVGIDLSILRISLELRIKINVASIVGMIVAAFIYNKF